VKAVEDDEAIGHLGEAYGEGDQRPLSPSLEQFIHAGRVGIAVAGPLAAAEGGEGLPGDEERGTLPPAVEPPANAEALEGLHITFKGGKRRGERYSPLGQYPPHD
jgi:hypothetical protein